MSIPITHRYNRRHKIVIAICTAVILLLNIVPIMAFTSDDVETEHKQCIELQKDPLCEKGADLLAYELSDDGKVLHKITKYNSCFDYYTNPRLTMKYPELVVFLSILYVIVEALVLIILVFVGIYEGFRKLFAWIETEDEDEDEGDDR